MPRESTTNAFIVDLFAGGGGASEGIRLALDRCPDVAVNHDAHAIAMHAENHPATDHYQEDVFAVDPVKACGGRRPDFLWASPDCTHFSRAKGAKPRSKKIRGLAWVVERWARAVRPLRIAVENVPEFETWGPLHDADHPNKKLRNRPIASRAGETFRAWVRALEELGYAVEWRVLTACDFGSPTSRRRLFVIARCDGKPVVWPEPTHGPGRARPWRTAAEIIDWSLDVPSIFGRRRPLADSTHRRIAAGIKRFVVDNPKPYVVDHLGRPVAPALIQTGYGERKGQAPRVLDLHKPLGTIVAGGQKHGLVAAWLAKHYSGVVGHGLERPIGSITSVDHHSLVTAELAGAGSPEAVAHFLSLYYSQGGQAQSVRDPLRTIVGRDRFALVSARFRGQRLPLTDIGLRMLQPHELAAAQGFPDGYVLTGTKRQKVARIGNSVPPQVVAAIVGAQFGLSSEEVVRAA